MKILKGLAVLGAALLAACGGGGDAPVASESVPASERNAAAQSVAGASADVAGPRGMFNRLPSFVHGEVHVTDYDGHADDLLTAGLGKTGLGGALPPFANALVPTAAELRRAAIYNSYRAIVDMTAAGGYGTLYGPNVGADGSITSGEGKIAGTEYVAFSRGADGSEGEPQNVVLLVQVPASFDPRRPCIVTATSSGSRGVYGAISTGEWGLKRGCAVAYTDKGTGSAPHDLANDTVPLIDGTRTTAALAGDRAQFRAPLTDAQRAALNAARPERFAFKHAHSQRNPEKDWGRFTLQAVEFAYWALNERHGIALPQGRKLRTIRPGHTLVIASSISNGGGAAIAAAELDRERLIDGVAVSEPAVELPAQTGIAIRRGTTLQPTTGKTLYDFTTHANLYQSCAALSPHVAGAPGSAFVVAAFAANRCASLKAKGLLGGDTLEAQANEALATLAAYGWEPESAVLHASLAAFEVAPAVSVTFANALARAGVADSLCGYSFAATTPTGLVAPLNPLLLAPMAATGNGVPPSSGVQLINDLNPGFALRDLFSFSPSTLKQDFNLDGALCLRALLTGEDAAAQALQRGIDETRRSGDLNGKPALIVHGRADALLPVNHTSRPYTALNKRVEGHRSQLSYIEVTNAQHFDGFIGLPTLLPGYDTRYVPLHVYLNRALDAMYEHLRQGKPLPPSQVVRTLPRGGTPGAAPSITEANVPPIALHPADTDRITMQGRTLHVPD
ncbi:D-(-)-3-hydroxybutyrate oligomer hydrolase [Piscinibacter sp. XHJ-5]|uniref:D-(-)-3-hydroxybutyrate oligomer hydrolase n=1 Tax=Piscinibacter sp. XHJ-5 TaxID=3037797 RepID=UPI0024534A46|nr:D-(-)-3-hydroxybutyrate oligomer hydrolase [Piscinibacter sp. XHJ-5]